MNNLHPYYSSFFTGRGTSRLTNGLTVFVAGVVLIVSAFSLLTVLVPKAGATGEQIVMGMPLNPSTGSGKWAYNVATTASCGYTSSQTAHPSCHGTAANSPDLLGYDWATDYYAASTTPVKLHGTSPQGAVAFSSVDAGSQGCGSGLVITANANGNSAGQIYATHLDNYVISSSLNSDAQIGTVRYQCYGVDHVHFSYKNIAGNHACYVNYSNQNYTAGMDVSYGASIGVLGSSNTGVQQACSSIPGSTTVSSVTYANIGGVYNVFWGTTDGNLYDTYWGNGTSLGTTQEASGLGTITSVAFYLNNGVYNILSGTSGGTVNQTFWGNGTNLTTVTKASGLGTVNSVAFYNDGGVYNIFSGTSGGNIYNTFWGNGTNLTTVTKASGLGTVNSVAYANINGVYNVLSGTSGGTVSDTYWGNGTNLGTTNEATQLGTVNSVAFQLINGIYNIFSGTSGGYLYDTYWGNGTSGNTIEATQLGTVNSVAFQLVNGVYNIFSGTSAGNLYDTYWGNGTNLGTTNEATGLGTVNSVASYIDAGVYNIFSGTSGGTVNQTFWGNGNNLTTVQKAP